MVQEVVTRSGARGARGSRSGARGGRGISASILPPQARSIDVTDSSFRYPFGDSLSYS